MKRYAVIWTPEAEDQLADIWLTAPDRAAVNAAQVEIDDLLSRDPCANGRDLGEGLFVINAAPLCANYVIDDANKTVTIDHVRRLP